MLAATRSRAAALGLRLAVTDGWDDIDDLAALRRLLVRSPTCATAQYTRAQLHSRLCRAGG